MSRLPKKFDLSELVGFQLNQVCVGPFDIQLHFENGLSIRGQGKVSGIIKQVKELWFQGEWLNTSYLPLIVGKEVAATTRINDFEFSIEFSEDICLTFEIEESQYEDFNINYPNGTMDVL